MPIKYQNICSTTSSVRFSSAKETMKKKKKLRRRRWRWRAERSRSGYYFTFAKPDDLCPFHRDADDPSSGSPSPRIRLGRLFLFRRRDGRSVTNPKVDRVRAFFVATDRPPAPDGRTIVNRLWWMCHVLMKAIFHLVERRLIALFTEERRSHRRPRSDEIVDQRVLRRNKFKSA